MNENSGIRTPARFLKTRLNEAEHQDLLRVLKGLGTTRSRMLRKMVRELIGQGPDLLPFELQLFREAIFQVGAIGRNLNQLVRAFHSGQLSAGSVTEAFMVEVRDHYESLHKELVAVVRRSRHRWVEHG